MSERALQQYRARLREALGVIERLQGKLAATQRAREPIAIVGLGCRFPGGCDDPDALWRRLEAGVDAVREIPADRWPPDALPRDRPELRWAALLDRVDAFDAEFFGISPREAERLDPQQRLLLEVTWEALEDAGIPIDAQAGAPVGVFAGLNSLDYQHRLMHMGVEHVDAYSATGTLLSTASGRISYSLGFRGPCVSIDTACSSSLVAVALACQSLRVGDCDLAVAGGVTLLLWPYMMALAGGTQALSPDGRCKALDARANGFVRGEGCGVVTLKRLSDARRDGDLVRAVIRGWSINQDGRSTGLTAPSVRAQEELIRAALRRAGRRPEDVGYLELHGTGTPLGDPIETDALRAVFGAPRADDSRCALGAVKTNLGHLEAAAGVAGLIKSVLALERGSIPKNLHFRSLNPRITLEGTPFVIPTESRPWPRGDKPRVAGVSSFGISGTNVHVVVEEAPEQARGPAPERAAELFVLSAKRPEALRALAGALREQLAERPELALVDVARSLATTRSPMERRLALVASSRVELLEQLTRAAAGDSPRGGSQGAASPARARLAFLFTGQGSQRPGMGRALHAAWPAYREALERCAALFDRSLARPLLEVMWAEPGSAEAALLDETRYTQPAIFAHGVALAALWRAWGVLPELVAGHSVGELVAACVAEVMSLEDAARLVEARGRLMQALPTGGAMASIEAREQEVLAALRERGETLSIAAVNAPTQVVISGAADAVERVRAAFAARGARTRSLRVSRAFHSSRMEPMLGAFADVAATVRLHPPTRAMISNLTGAPADASIATPEYWVRHARDGVRFADGARALYDAGARTFVELGAAAALLGSVSACVPEDEDAPVSLVPSVVPRRGELASTLDALGRLWTLGHDVAWAEVFPAEAGRARLPRYPWQRRRFWIDPPQRADAPAGEATDHPLLGVRIPNAGASTLFEVHLSRDRLPWLDDHRVAGRAVVPAAAFAEMIAAALAREGDARDVSGLTIIAPLVLPEREPLRVQLVCARERDEGLELGVYSQPLAGATGWTRHATATSVDATGRPPAEELDALRRGCPRALDVDALYGRFEALGITYGPSFRGVRSLWTGERAALAEVAAPPAGRDPAFTLAPTLLDAGLQVVLAALPDVDEDGLLMPFELARLSIYRAGATSAWVHARLRGDDDRVADVRLFDAAGELVAEVEGLRLQPADPAAITRGAAGSRADALFQVAWAASGPPAPAPRSDGRWLLVTDGAPTRAPTLARELAGLLDRCELAAAEELPRALAAGDVAGVICLFEHDDEAPPVLAETLTSWALTISRHTLAGPQRPRLVWVTRGAVAVTPGEPVAAARSSVWGLGRTVRLEHPDARLRLVDLPLAQPVDALAATLARELTIDDDEDQVAWRGGGRHVARLRRAEERADRRGEAHAPLTPRGTTLVTGGLGALGGHVARWLARRGAEHLLLTGRRGLDTPGARELVAELERAGTRVTVAALDVADREPLAAAIDQLPPEYPLRGVVHAAGVLVDGLATALTAEAVARVFAPKARGAWNLHELTRARALDFFVLFSSLASALGSAGQASYAAANSFLDGLAAARRARGLPAQSLAWGPWSEGMVARLDARHQDRLARLGLRALTPARGVALLERALSRGDALLAIAEFELAAVAREHHAPPPLWRELVRAPDRPPRDDARGALAERLAALPPPRRDARVRAELRDAVRRVLSWDDRDPLPDSRPLQELGLDSLMAIELRDALARRLGARLPATLAFDHPTIEALTARLSAHVESLATRDPAPRPTSSPVEPTSSDDTPIAIIGMSCRLPGGVTDPESLWSLLDAGRDAIAEVPPERWDIDALYDEDPDAPGTVTTRCGGFVADIDQFDPAFFGISPREAAHMDPQQRLLLETSWEALERAGVPPDRLKGSDAGVFVGLMYQEYGALIDDLEALDGYVSTGSAASVAAGRISYALGLKGPSIAVDTACSSSLVTTHLACQSLRRGECSLALTGGVALMLTPTVFVEFSRLRGLAADGRCKSFSAAADGVGWSEGCGVLVLKRLPDALRDGDPILGVIRGSAVNQDGRSNGLTAPSGPSQEEVIRSALRSARLSPDQLDYVECHGTGTSLGDPIELGALGAVLTGTSTRRPRPLVVGSIKSNLGHTQAAAGVVGIMKVLLALAHERVPANLHFDAPSPHVPWSELPLTVAAQPMPWPRRAAPRRAGVSSFGVSGTNAHVVLEEAPPRDHGPAAPPEPDAAELFVISARTPAALRRVATRLREHVAARPALTPRAVASALATTRSAMDERAALVASSREALDEALTALAADETPAGCARARVAPSRPGVAFVFSGQGGQWPGMGRQLLASEPAFRASLEACDRAIAAETGWSVVQVLEDMCEDDGGDARHARVEVIQPVLFSLQVALAALWRARGVEPDAVVGHSMGEVAAAHVAGALSLEDAARVICRRSQLLQRVAGAGEMAVVERARAEAEEALRGREALLSVAACNGPRSTVIAGEPGALADVLRQLESEGVFCRRVNVDVASHSPQVEPLREPLREALAGLRPAPATTRFISTVRGDELRGDELDAAYWVDNLRLPVRFAEAVDALLADDIRLFVELSPHPVLTTSIAEARRDAVAPVAVGSLRRDVDERRALLEAQGALWSHGCEVRWNHDAGPRITLPTYPWERSRHWIEPRQPGAPRGQHPLLGDGRSVSAVPGMRVWESELTRARPRWLADHQVDGAVLLPAAGLLEMALTAAAELLGDGARELADVELHDALTLLEEPTRVQLVATAEAGRATLRILSQRVGASTGPWTLHAEGVARAVAPTPAERLEVEALCDALAGPESSAQVYAQLAARGLEYGPAFRGVVELWRGDGEALGRVRTPRAAAGARRHALHPAALDACFQVLLGALEGGDAATWLPVGVGALEHLKRPSGELWCHARLFATDAPGRRRAELRVADASGELVLRARDLVIQRVASRREDDRLIEMSWETSSINADRRAAGPHLILGGGPAGRALRRALESAGLEVVHAIATAPPTITDGEWPVDDGDPAAIRSLLRDAFPDGAPTRVIHLRSLERDAGGEDAVEDAVEAALRRGCDSALHTVQALAAMGYRDAPRLILATRGAQAVPGRARAIAALQAPALGLARVIAMEHPELRCLRVDLDPARPEDDVSELMQEVLGDSSEQELAWRDGTRYAARLVRGSLRDRGSRDDDRAPRSRVRGDGSYLITGGLGGLGLRVAAWLAARGAGHLVLLGRAGVTREDQRAAVEALRAGGAAVSIARVDVADRDALARVLAELASSVRPLVGIVHAAGVLDDGLLVTQSRARLRTVTAPKLRGAWNLHALSEEAPLELFVMFSSAAGLIGAPGQGNYAAANAFLDALAHHRRARGRPALSVDWGAFTEVGLAAADERRGARLATRGVRSLTPDEGLEVLEQLLAADVTQMAVMPFDARQWIEFYPAASGWTTLAPLLRGGSSPRRAPELDALRARLAAADEGGRAQLLEDVIRREAARVLRCQASALDLETTFTSLGMDSLMGLELRNRVEAALGVRVAATALWSHPTVTRLAAHVASALHSPAPPPKNPASRPDDATARAPEGLAEEDDLLSLLDESLARARTRSGQAT